MDDNQKVLQLFTPSWVTNVIGVAFALLLTAGVIVLTQFQGSEIQMQIFDAQSAGTGIQQDITYQQVAENMSDNKFLGSLPLLLTWACVGLVVYFLAMSIAKSIGGLVNVRDQLEYVHTSRDALLRETFVRLGLRLVAIVGLLIVLRLSFGILIPYALASANIAGQNVSVTSAGYVLLSMIVLYVVVYLITLALRLVSLRPRVIVR